MLHTYSMIFGNIAGSEIIQITALVVICGVALRTWGGMKGQPISALKWNTVFLTLIISCLTAFPVVMTTFEAIPAEASAETWFIAIIMGITAVYGTDKVAEKTGFKSKLPGGNPKNGIDDLQDIEKLNDDAGPPR